MRKSVAVALLAATLLLVISLALSSVRLDSATADEPAHIVNGVIKISQRWPGFFREQPPLMNSISAVPVVLAGYRMPPQWKGENHWTAGRRLLYASGYDAYAILFLARLPTIALFAALVAVMYWFVLRQTASHGYALAAAVLTGFCPNLMAHGRLATVDLALTFFAFTSAALLIVLMKRPSPGLAVLFGVSATAAALSKISGLVLLPYFALVVIGGLVTRRIAEPRRFLKALAIAVVSAIVFFEAVGLAVTSAAYAREAYPSLPRIAVPFADYLTSIRTIQQWYSRGHELPQFLMGEFSQEGWPQYYLVALLLKTPIPAILLAIAGIVVGFRRKPSGFVALLAFVILFLAFAAAGHLAIGLRYVLPVYPFLYAATAIALHASGPGRRGVAIVAALLVWHAAENLRIYPSYIAYFNEMIGSQRNADRFLIDSNLDWGQDLRRLDQWAAANGVQQLTVHYFGGGSVEYELRSARPVVLYAPVRLPAGYFALSRHFYRMSFFLPAFGVDYDTVLEASKARYVTTIGDSILVYRVERE